MAGLEAVEGIPAVGVVLLDEEVLGAARQTGLDAGLDGQAALAHLGELDGILEAGHELHHGLPVGGIQAALGDLHLADAVVLQMEQPDGAGVLLDELHGVLAAPVDPVGIQLKAHVGGVGPDDVQQVLAVILHKLHMVIVVIEVDAVLLQLEGALLGLVGEVHRLLVAAHAGHGEHTDAEHIAVQGLTVGHDLLVAIGITEELTGHTGDHGGHRGGVGGDLHAQLVNGAAEAGDVLRRHGHLGDLDAVEAQVGELGHGLVSVKVGHFGRGDGGHLNTDQTFVGHWKYTPYFLFSELTGPQ